MKISLAMLQCLCNFHQVFPKYLHVVFRFGKRESDAGESLQGVTYRQERSVPLGKAADRVDRNAGSGKFRNPLWKAVLTLV